MNKKPSDLTQAGKAKYRKRTSHPVPDSPPITNLTFQDHHPISSSISFAHQPLPLQHFSNLASVQLLHLLTKGVHGSRLI